MSDQNLSLIRTVLKMAGTYFTAQGIGDGVMWEALAGGVAAAVGIFMSYKAHKSGE